jgi:DNA replication protein DnaC
MRYGRQSFLPGTHTPQAICFDDLGLEPLMQHYGNTCNVMAEVLLSRYDCFATHGMITHITTNLNSAELEDHYGKRIRSRMRELFNLIAFARNAPDKRV